MKAFPALLRAEEEPRLDLDCVCGFFLSFGVPWSCLSSFPGLCSVLDPGGLLLCQVMWCFTEKYCSLNFYRSYICSSFLGFFHSVSYKLLFICMTDFTTLDFVLTLSFWLRMSRISSGSSFGISTWSLAQLFCWSVVWLLRPDLICVVCVRFSAPSWLVSGAILFHM